MSNASKLLWRAFDLPALVSFLRAEDVQLEREPESANGHFGKGQYFYESIQKALENTLVHRALAKRDLLDPLAPGSAPDWNQTALDSEFLFHTAQVAGREEAVPRLTTNVFFVLFEVATGNEFANASYLFLKELPLGFHSAKMEGKYQPRAERRDER